MTLQVIGLVKTLQGHIQSIIRSYSSGITCPHRRQHHRRKGFMGTDQLDTLYIICVKC